MSEVRLILGDCLEVMAGMEAFSVDAVIADPPYSTSVKSDMGGKLNPWADLCNAAYWYGAWLASARRLLKIDGCLWTFLNWRTLPTIQKASCDLGWPVESLLVWDKQWIGPGGHRGLRPSYELVALFCGEDFALSDRSLPDIWPCQWTATKPTGHPAEKPVPLLRRIIEVSTAPGATVLDPFMGSGSTGEAAVDSGRAFIGIEIDENWLTFARARIDAATRQGVLL